MKQWVAYVFIAAAFTTIYFGGLPGLVIGVAILLYVAISARMSHQYRRTGERLQILETRAGGTLQTTVLGSPSERRSGEEECSFSFPDPAPSGWEKYTVFPSRQTYKRNYCFGGPPTYDETWEYEVRESQIFHRLVEARKEYFGDPIFEVIRGTVLESIKQTTRAKFADNLIDRYRKNIEWHECKDSVRFELLAIHLRSESSKLRDILERKQKKFAAGCSELESKLAALGAVEQDSGRGSYFTAPDGATEAVAEQIMEIQRGPSSRSSFSDAADITPIEFTTRKLILATLNRLLSGLLR
jgi:hypothetical protein